MKLHELKPAPGSKHRKKIVGRGEGSGHGGTATRGMKGQGSRSGERVNVGFEGGQMPLIRRIPKRGFNHTRFRTAYSPVNTGDLQAMDGTGEITPAFLEEKRLVKKGMPVKILGEGELSKPLTVKAHAFSKSAEKKIVQAGGTIEKIALP